MQPHTLLDPFSRGPLLYTQILNHLGFGILRCSTTLNEWPVVLGICYVRSDRVLLAKSVVESLKKSDFEQAIALLLQDTDDFAPQKPHDDECRRIAVRVLQHDDSLLASEVMEACRFGPVADYFYIRGSTPTFMSGINLLKIGMLPFQPLVEIGCGVGHFLYWLKTRNVDVIGVDSVFSKLYIASRFMHVPADKLICAVSGADAPLPLQTYQATTVFCHDVFYFIRDKVKAIADFRRIAGSNGNILVGHAHLANVDHGIVSGYPLLLSQYRELASENAFFFDDAALVTCDLKGKFANSLIPTQAEAISFVDGVLNQGHTSWWHCAHETLYAPMQVTYSREDHVSQMHWPGPAFADEYRIAPYLTSSHNPFEYLPYRGDGASIPISSGLSIPEPFFSLGVRPLRWGIVGGGWIARDYFEPSFEFVPHAKLVAICDTNRDRLKEFAGNKHRQLFSDLSEMLSACELDAVYISTPNCSHASIFELVATHNIRVLCEKPLATNADDIDRIEKSLRSHPNHYQTAFDQRYHPAHIKLAREIAAGVLGKVTHVRIHYACWVDDKWNKVPLTENWRIDFKQAGGGAGFDLLPHCLDLILMLLSDTVDAAYLMYQYRVHDYSSSLKVDDGALLTIKTHKGILASMHVGYNCPENQPRRQIEIIGTQGRVVAIDTMGQDPGGELVWLIDGIEKREVFPQSKESGPFVRQLDALTRNWLRGDVARFPIEDDLQLARVLIRCDTVAQNAGRTEYVNS